MFQHKVITRRTLTTQEWDAILTSKSEIRYCPSPNSDADAYNAFTVKLTYRPDATGHIYRLVSLPPLIAAVLPVPPRLLHEKEWQLLGVQQSQGWEHFHVTENEPHVLWFRKRV